jgi:hypothetical protein
MDTGRCTVTAAQCQQFSGVCQFPRRQDRAVSRIASRSVRFGEGQSTALAVARRQFAP